MIIFGPVPSRRLGQSLGVNNIPPKICSYSCVYCQLGRTDKMQIRRQEFYKPEEIYRLVGEKIDEVVKKGEAIDYITYVADGEPTLDINLGKEIKLLKSFGIKIAVISNASLIWLRDVKSDLLEADWVSLKIDAIDEKVWKKIDRPQGQLDHEKILSSALDFSKEYKGALVTETMMVCDYNDEKGQLEQLGNYLKELKPAKAYLTVPTRPPAESGIKRPSREKLGMAYKLVTEIAGIQTECVTEDESESFFFADNVESDLLEIMSVHPMRDNVLSSLLKDKDPGKKLIKDLLDRNLIEPFYHEGKKFYRKKFK